MTLLIYSKFVDRETEFKSLPFYFPADLVKLYMRMSNSILAVIWCNFPKIQNHIFSYVASGLAERHGPILSLFFFFKHGKI